MNVRGGAAFSALALALAGACTGSDPAPPITPAADGGGATSSGDATSPAAPFKITVTPAQTIVEASGTANVTVEVARESGFFEPVAFRIDDLPATFTANAPPLSATDTKSVLKLATANAAPGPTTLTVVGTSSRGEATAKLEVLVSAGAGKPDTTFAGGGTFTVDPGAGKTFDPAAIRVQPDGKILIAGTERTGTGGATHFQIVRLKANGALDPDFGVNGITAADALQSGRFAAGSSRLGNGGIALQSDGAIVAAGTDMASAQEGKIIRFRPNGAADTMFGTGGATRLTFGTAAENAVNGAAIGVHPDNDGLYFAGWIDNKTGVEQGFVARYDEKGALVDTYGNTADPFFVWPETTTGSVTSTYFFDLAVRGDGYVLAVGKIEPSSGSRVIIKPVAPTGKALADGTVKAVTQRQASGSGAVQIVAAPGGKYAVVAAVLDAGTAHDALIGVNADGSDDGVFGKSGVAVEATADDDAPSGVAVQADGKLLVASTTNGKANVLRFAAGGQGLDTKFGATGRAIAFDSQTNAVGVAVQPDGRIVVLGRAHKSSLGEGHQAVVQRFWP